MPSKNIHNVLRGSRWVFVVAILVVTGLLFYAAGLGADQPAHDRNVPGATTGPGKASLTE
jgi:hypothetical protein